MPGSAYPIAEVLPEWVLEMEALGSKTKFWDCDASTNVLWLYKYSQPGTGQHWSEKIAAEVAGLLEIRAARVELAVFQNARGFSDGILRHRRVDPVPWKSNTRRCPTIG